MTSHWIRPRVGRVTAYDRETKRGIVVVRGVEYAFARAQFEALRPNQKPIVGEQVEVYFKDDAVYAILAPLEGKTA